MKELKEEIKSNGKKTKNSSIIHHLCLHYGTKKTGAMVKPEKSVTCLTNSSRVSNKEYRKLEV